MEVGGGKMEQIDRWSSLYATYNRPFASTPLHKVPHEHPGSEDVETTALVRAGASASGEEGDRKARAALPRGKSEMQTPTSGHGVRNQSLYIFEPVF